LASLSSIAETKFGMTVGAILEEGDPQKVILDIGKKFNVNMFDLERSK
jgi:hypothetical protein